MKLERAVLKTKNTWSGWSVLMRLLLLPWAATRGLWGRFWPTRTRLGGDDRRLGELPKRLSKFLQGSTSSNRVHNLCGAFKIVDRPVRDPYNPPPIFLKSNVTQEVFVTLHRGIVRWAVNLHHYAILDEGKVYYDPITKEWVLGTIRFSILAYAAFKYRLMHGWVRIEPGPVTEEVTH